MAIFREKTTQDLSAGALSFQKGFAQDVVLSQVIFKASTQITETVTVTFKSKDGATYDAVLDSSSLVNDTDYIFRPQGRCILMKGDGILVACTDANNTGTVGVTVMVESIP